MVYTTILPEITDDGMAQEAPFAVLHQIMYKKENAARVQVLVQWAGHKAEKYCKSF